MWQATSGFRTTGTPLYNILVIEAVFVYQD